MNREKYPERVPFRLTRMLVAAMEVSGIEGSFRSVCERVMRVMRKNKNSVMALLEAFIYDPLWSWRWRLSPRARSAEGDGSLVNWRLMEHKGGGRKGMGGSGSGGSGGGAGSGKEKGLPPPPVLTHPTTPTSSSSSSTVTVTLPASSPPLSSPVQSLLAPPQVLDRRRSIVEEEAQLGDAANDVVNEKAMQVVQRVESKLKGTDFAGEGGEGSEGLTVEGQVQRLIEEATSHINLCQAYIGWCPFW